MSNVRLPITPAGTEAIRFIGATLIDGRGGSVLNNAEIFISGDRIIYVGTEQTESNFLASHEQAAHAKVIDLAGKTVMPGFIDTHVHLGLQVEERAEDEFRFQSERTIRAAVNARRTLFAGVTSARDVGGIDGGLRDAIAQGLTLGPRLHISISILSPTGGHSDDHTANGCCPHHAMPINPIVDTDDEVRKTVRLLVRSGADVIKVCTTGGVSSPTDTPEDLGITEHQVRLIVEETARRANQPVAAHAQGTQGILEAIRGGVRSVEHGYQLDDEGIGLMLEKELFLVPTLTTALRMPDPANVPDYLYQKKAVWSALARKHVAKAISSGVKVAMGTDSGVCPHGVNLRELGHMVDLGMEPMTAIVSGTRNAAALMRLDDQLGTLEAGKLADMVIVNFDPLKDIHNMADADNIAVVIQSGRVVKDKHHWLPMAIEQAGLG